MNQTVVNILEKLKGKTVALFVDEANIFYSQKALGWRIEWKRACDFLKDRCTLSSSRYYMGMPLDKNQYERNVIVKDRLQKCGFEIVTKPLKKIYIDSEKKRAIYKCNFDVEITRDVIRTLDNTDVVLVASSDSDFIGLRNDVLAHNKGFMFLCFEQNVAWEIRRSHHIFFEDIREYVEYVKIKNPEENSG
ncbi:NYN domain-containing protein [Candidatus Uhrbacteria bacterium]|nr:NYN domain-containing protein [Candidatus Uhrbacteria bacterium]